MFGEKTAEHSRLEGLPTAPPAYNEPSHVVQPPNVQPPFGQPQAQMGQYPQYPQQVQVGGVPPQMWPAQGYQVSYAYMIQYRDICSVLKRETGYGGTVLSSATHRATHDKLAYVQKGMNRSLHLQIKPIACYGLSEF